MGSEDSVSRRTFLAGSAAGLVLAAVGSSAGEEVGAMQAASGFRTSLSVSPFTEGVLAKTTLSDGIHHARTVDQVQRLFIDHGSTEVYVRVATNGSALQEALKRASLARKLGLPLNPELGLWNQYGDVSYQPAPDFSDFPEIALPGSWSTLTIDQMASAMHLYGKLVAKRILSTGVDVNVWDIGNEVEFGIAGVALQSFTSQTPSFTYTAPNAVDPVIGMKTVIEVLGMPTTERSLWLETHLWPYVGRILTSVAEGIRTVDRHARFSTHNSTVSTQLIPDLLVPFWRSIHKAGFEPECCGVSYYPSQYSSTNGIEAFQNQAAALHRAIGRPVFIAETAYPSAPLTAAPFNGWNYTIEGYDHSPEGVHKFWKGLTSWGVRTGHLAGIRPWGPDFCTGGWQPMSLFTSSENGVAKAELSLDAFKNGIAAASKSA